jgi:Ala-tRNA(Pro) deacylase
MTETAPKTAADLFAFLDTLGIAHETLWHPPVFTAHDTIDWGTIDGGLHLKNLFVENKEGRKWLITMPADTRADMNAMGKQLGSGRLSFVKGEQMLPILGVPPGHATPFALLNGSAHVVTAVVDARVPHAPRLNVHPLTNTGSTVISGAGLMHFYAAVGHDVQVIHTTKVEHDAA